MFNIHSHLLFLYSHIVFIKAAQEKIAKQLQHQFNECQGKLDETNRTLNDFDAAKKKLSIENSDLLRQLEEAESQVSQLSKIKISLTTQLEDTKRLADEEGRVCIIYSGMKTY